MKKLILISIVLFQVMVAAAQTTSSSIPDKSYGSGGTKTVTTIKSESGEEHTITEIKDSEGKVRDRNHTWKQPNGSITVSDSNFTRNGNLFKTVQQSFDEMKVLINSTSSEYAGGSVVWTGTRERNADGTYKVHIDDKEKGKTFDRTEAAGATYINPPSDFKHLPKASSGCLARVEASLGYSFLWSKIGDERESYPLGANLTATYNLSEKWGVQLDASWHTKKKDDFKYNQTYLFGGLQYDFKKEEQCRQDVNLGVLARVLLGGSFFSEVYDMMGNSNKYKDCAFAFGFGGTVELKISETSRFFWRGDYIGANYDGYLDSFRTGIGVTYMFNERRTGATRYNY